MRMKFVAMIVAALACCAVPALADGATRDIGQVTGNRATLTVWNVSGRRLACEGRIDAVDVYGNARWFTGRFGFPQGERGPHGLVYVAPVPLASASYAYWCNPY